MRLIYAFGVLLLGSCLANSQALLLDDFEDVSSWTPIVSDGVSLKIGDAPGVVGKALLLDFEFHGGAGYAIAQRSLPLDLPQNYRFTFYLRGETPVNNFEFKLLDANGNVFWLKRLDVEYPRSWQKTIIRKRQITFAWGPAGGGTIGHVEKVEFVVSAGSGGKGRVFIDRLVLEPIDASPPENSQPEVTASSSLPTAGPQLVFDRDSLSCWRSSKGSGHAWLMMRFPNTREIGGLVIDWDHHDYATAFALELSDDSIHWTKAYGVTDGRGGRSYIPLSEAEAKLIRLDLQQSARGRGYAIGNIDIKGAEFAATPNALFGEISQYAPKGFYPKYFLPKQSYWTIVGAAGDTKEALINEEGAIETEKGGFTIEPFLFVDGQLITWHDAVLKQSLERGYLPIPSVEWYSAGLHLNIRAFASGEPGKSRLVATYRIESSSKKPVHGILFLALRPFQVNPPWQDLNMAGGTSRINSVRSASGVVWLNERKRVIPLQRPDGFGVAEFDEGDITSFLQSGVLPRRNSVIDHFGYASAALKYSFDVSTQHPAEFTLLVPFHEVSDTLHATMSPAKAHQFVEALLNETRRFWESKVSLIDIRLPLNAMDVVNTIKTTLAYIFINQDGPAIQPGSRTYKRAWIRDGALTSTALLQTGNMREVREYLDWYSAYQYPNGKIPCVVDSRGADPVPEYDSNGEFIYAVMQYFKFSHDTLWLRAKFPNVKMAVHYIQELRSQRKTELYRSGTPEQQACYGLVPESISHEGYSAKPMHSYWDDFFVMKGLKDAATIAAVLGDEESRSEFAAERDDFRRCLYASMQMAMNNTRIDFIPGCVELGDFDATSTTIGINPCGELGNIPEPQLRKTFDKYYALFTRRLHDTIDWINYTPYEVRVIGAFVYLDQKQRAQNLLQFFMKDRRPQEWNHWAEVVWRDPSTPRLIGDMPHTWVGSDYIRAVRSMFVYEREQDTALVVGAGVPEEWIAGDDGLEVQRLPTYDGLLSYTMRKSGNDVVVDLSGTIRVPAGKIILKSPRIRPLGSAIINGRPLSVGNAQEVVVDEFPARITLHYEGTQ